VPPLTAIVVKAAPDHRRGSASATFFISFDVGYGIGGLLWGVVIDLVGFRAMFSGCASLVLISLLLSVIFLKTDLNQTKRRVIEI